MPSFTCCGCWPAFLQGVKAPTVSAKRYRRAKYSEREYSIEFENLIDEEDFYPPPQHVVTATERDLLARGKYRELFQHEAEIGQQQDDRLNENEENARLEDEAYIQAKREAAKVAKQKQDLNKVKSNGTKNSSDAKNLNSAEFSKWLSEDKIDMTSEELDAEDFESFLEKVRAKGAQAMNEVGKNNEAFAFEETLSQGLAATKIAGDALNALQPVELHAVSMMEPNHTPTNAIVSNAIVSSALVSSPASQISEEVMEINLPDVQVQQPIGAFPFNDQTVSLQSGSAKEIINVEEAFNFATFEEPTIVSQPSASTNTVVVDSTDQLIAVSPDLITADVPSVTSEGIAVVPSNGEPSSNGESSELLQIDEVTTALAVGIISSSEQEIILESVSQSDNNKMEDKLLDISPLQEEPKLEDKPSLKNEHDNMMVESNILINGNHEDSDDGKLLNLSPVDDEPKADVVPAAQIGLELDDSFVSFDDGEKLLDISPIDDKKPKSDAIVVCNGNTEEDDTNTASTNNGQVLDISSIDNEKSKVEDEISHNGHLSDDSIDNISVSTTTTTTNPVITNAGENTLNHQEELDSFSKTHDFEVPSVKTLKPNSSVTTKLDESTISDDDFHDFDDGFESSTSNGAFEDYLA